MRKGKTYEQINKTVETNPPDTLNNSNLPSFFLDDTLSLSEISEKVLLMKRKQEIIRKYENKIKTRKDGRQFYIYINRKQYTAVTFDALINLLFEMEYGRECNIPVCSSHTKNRRNAVLSSFLPLLT